MTVKCQHTLKGTPVLPHTTPALRQYKAARDTQRARMSIKGACWLSITRKQWRRTHGGGRQQVPLSGVSAAPHAATCPGNGCLLLVCLEGGIRWYQVVLQARRYYPRQVRDNSARFKDSTWIVRWFQVRWHSFAGGCAVIKLVYLHSCLRKWWSWEQLALKVN